MSGLDPLVDARRRLWVKDVDKTRRDLYDKGAFPEPQKPLRNLAGGGVNDDPQTWYEDGPNGQWFWKAQFKMYDFDLKDIKVDVNPDRTLSIRGKTQARNGGKVISKEFSRQMELPSEVKIEEMSGILSADGILTVEAPVKISKSVQQPKAVPRAMVASSLNTQAAGSSGLPRVSRSPSPKFRAAPALEAIIGRKVFAMPNRGIVLRNAGGENVMQWSYNLESDVYKAEEISVRVRSTWKLAVTALHEETKGDGKVRHEFSREYDLPDTVDPRTVTVFYRPEQSTLYIEAKLLPQFQTALEGRGERLPVTFE